MKTWGLASFILFCAGLVLAVIGGLFLPGNVIAGGVPPFLVPPIMRDFLLLPLVA